MKKFNVLSNMGIFILILLINYFLWGKYLLGMVLNGDDVIVLFEAQKYLSGFWSNLFAFSGQYRPLGRMFFGLYLPFKFSFQEIYFVHLLIFSTIQFLFYLVARQKLNIRYSLFLSLFIFFNPIFYYHIFAVASDMNLQMIGLLLVSVLLIQHKKYLWILPVFICAILIKETFIMLIPLVLFAIWKLDIRNRTKFLIAGAILAITTSYLVIRFTSYKVTDESYRFIYTMAKAKENIGNIVAWLINHPRGWEFGIYGFRNIYNYVLDGVLLALWAVGLYISFKNNKHWLIVLAGVLIFSLLPFVFLNRTLFFYMDAPFVVLGLLLIPVMQNKWAPVTAVILLVTILISHTLYFSRWINYSFVGNSNLIAKNFISTISKDTITPGNDLCIINHSLGSWPTQNGNLIYFIKKDFTGKIFSINDDDPSLCGAKSVIFRNEGADYIRI